MITQLIYTSQRCDSLSDAGLDALLVQARQNNARRGLTGVLLCTGTQFMQVIEGPAAEVARLADTIAEDTRHEDMRIVMSHEVAQPDFGDWHMALSDVRARGLLPGCELSRFFEPDFNIGVLPAASVASFLLRAFRDIVISDR